MYSHGNSIYLQTDRVSYYLASTNQDVLVAVRETHYHGLSWSFAFQQAPRNELFSTFRSPGMHHFTPSDPVAMIFTSEYCYAGSQVDVIFPFDHELQATFGELETDYYYTSRAPLAEIYESLRESGLSRCVFAGLTVSLPTQTSSFWYQVTLMLRVPEHFCLMRGRAGREALS